MGLGGGGYFGHDWLVIEQSKYVNMCLMSTETIRLFRDGGMEDGIKQQFQILRLVMAVMMVCVCVGGVLWARVARKTAPVCGDGAVAGHNNTDVMTPQCGVAWPAAVAYRLCLRRLLER